jgi:hypothetical protein
VADNPGCLNTATNYAKQQEQNNGGAHRLAKGLAELPPLAVDGLPGCVDYAVPTPVPTRCGSRSAGRSAGAVSDCSAAIETASPSVDQHVII